MKQYTTLVLSGGAVKGFALLGALQYAMDQGALANVKKYVGTSIGAIVAYLLCIGFSPVEMMVLLCQTQFLNKLAHFDLCNIIQGSGAVSYSVLNDILEKITVQKIGRFVTLKQLEDEYGKVLICCTFNYTKNQEEFLCSADYPDLPCLTALRMSTNLPLVFEPFLYDGSVYLDGGLSSNFAVHHVDSKEEIVLGLSLAPTSASEPDRMPSPLELLWKMLAIPMSLLQTLRLKNISNENMDIIEIPLDDFFCLQFDVSKSQKFDMFSIGYDTIKEFFEHRKVMDYESDGKSEKENTSGGPDVVREGSGGEGVEE